MRIQWLTDFKLGARVSKIHDRISITHALVFIIFSGCAPQQCLLLMHFVSAVMSIMAGHYHDGYAPNGGSAFIFADQIWLLMVVVVHTLEYIEAL